LDKVPKNYGDYWVFAKASFIFVYQLFTFGEFGASVEAALMTHRKLFNRLPLQT